jgi:hypothetical protein
MNALDGGDLDYLFQVATFQNIDRPFIAQKVILVDQEVQYRPRAPKPKRRLNIS